MADVEDDVIFERPDILSRTEKKDSRAACNKRIVTVMLCAAFFGLGLCLAIPGPTLLDLEENTNSDSGHISLIFTSRSMGYLLGSVIGGVLFSYINQACLLSVAMLVTGIATAVAPWCIHLLSLAVMIMFQGISMGFLDTGGNLICLETWGRDNGPPMQALHFSFGFGAFLAPLIAAPFLHNGLSFLNESIPEMHQNASNTSTVVVETSPVKYAYLIIAVFVSLTSIGFVMLACCTRKSDSASKTMEALKSEYTIRQDQTCFRIKLLASLFVFYFLYVGAEVTYGSLVSKFAVDQLGWSKQNAALVNSVFWGSFAVGRFLAIFLARCLEPVHMLIGDLVISTISFFGLAMVDRTKELLAQTKLPDESLFWVFTATLGLGLASVFPSGISWVERYMKVTGKAAAVFVVGSALGEMVLPALTGYLFHWMGSMWLMYVLLIVSSLSIVVYVVMVNVACSVGERYSKLANQEEDMELLKVTDDDGHSLGSSQADCSNGHDGPDRKKRVTFGIMNSAPMGSKDGNAKSSILRSKRVEKKD